MHDATYDPDDFEDSPEGDVAYDPGDDLDFVPTPDEIAEATGPGAFADDADVEPPDEPPRRRRQPERDIQVAVATYLDRREDVGGCYCHPPNGGFRAPQVGRQMRRQGTKPGVPDLLIFRPCILDKRLHHGLAIELKAPGNRHGPTKDQARWLAMLEAQGWYTAVLKSYSDTVDLIERAYDLTPDVLTGRPSRAERVAHARLILETHGARYPRAHVALAASLSCRAVSEIAAEVIGGWL